MIYLKAEIAIHPGHMPAMLDLLTDRVFPIMEGKGSWRMMDCFVQRTGRINTIVDIWAMDSYLDFAATYEVFRNDPDYPEIRTLLDTYVATETLVFMDRHHRHIEKLED